MIKYSCENNDKWYIGELGLMIEKKIWGKGNLANKKGGGEISWYGSRVAERKKIKPKS